MEEFETHFAELSFKVARLKVSLRIKRQSPCSEEDSTHERDLHGELNQAYCVSPSSQENTMSRRASLSSVDSGFSSSFSRSRRNSLTSLRLTMDKNVEESESDCFVIADDEFETYFQPDKSQVQRPRPKFVISDHDISDDYSEVYVNEGGTVDQDTPPPLPPRNMSARPPCLPPYPSSSCRRRACR